MKRRLVKWRLVGMKRSPSDISQYSKLGLRWKRRADRCQDPVIGAMPAAGAVGSIRLETLQALDADDGRDKPPAQNR